MSTNRSDVLENCRPPEEIPFSRAEYRQRLERIRREELRQLDPQQALALLCGEADYTVPPRAPRPTSGLIEQQRWFKKAFARRD